MTLPDDMQALVLLQAGYASAPAGAEPAALTELVALQRVPVPRPGPGQVLVKVALSPINPSDLLYVAGTYGQPRVRGTPAGFEGTGVVVAIGDTRASALSGRRVSFLAGASGAWADYALADAASCVAVDDALRDEDAAVLLVNPLTAIAMTDIAVHLGVNAVVLTAAGSQVGRMMIPLARERDIAPIAIVRKPDAIGALQELGAAEVLASNAPDFSRQLAGVLRARKPRILFDAVGDQLAADIFLAMPSHSRWISYGILSTKGPCMPDMRPFVFQGKHIEGFWLSRWLGAAHPEARSGATQEVQRRFLDGTWRTQIATRVPLGDAPHGLPSALDLPGKVLLAP
ncbi:MAG: zinc-binding dehydrogenase [Burkholderiaceae bacterium]|nr:zinc-binding dehydrogenase [Burkholderiaceae bacterium]MEB2351661.1 zinc-binding dehydrogenase [Burkholderiaceae bacterium]